MAITIGRGQRDAIYEEIALDLNGLTDLWTEFERGEFERARELRRRFERDMRLLDDLGWEPEQDCDEFELTMEAADLAAAIVHLNGQTGAILHTHIVEPIERSPDTARSVMAQTAFGAILAQLAQGSPAAEATKGDR
jgi:hypothetical protein